MSIAEHTEPQLNERPTMLPPDPRPDVDFDVVVTVSDAAQGPTDFPAFTQNYYFDLGWWNTMDQSKVSPVNFSAHKEIGRTRTAIPLTLSGTAHLYNPTTQVWSAVLTIPTKYHLNGQATFDPRSLVTAQFPWIGSLGLVVWASASYGVGLHRIFARSMVHADGCIAYIN